MYPVRLISDEFEEFDDVDDLIGYFFAEFPCFIRQHEHHRLYKKPTPEIE